MRDWVDGGMLVKWGIWFGGKDNEFEIEYIVFEGFREVIDSFVFGMWEWFELEI